MRLMRKALGENQLAGINANIEEPAEPCKDHHPWNCSTPLTSRLERDREYEMGCEINTQSLSDLVQWLQDHVLSPVLTRR
jgi:hypothetical protein